MLLVTTPTTGGTRGIFVWTGIYRIKRVIWMV